MTYTYIPFAGAGRDVAPSGERVRLRMEDLGNYTCRVRSPVHTEAPASMVQLKVQCESNSLRCFFCPLASFGLHCLQVWSSVWLVYVNMYC